MVVPSNGTSRPTILTPKIDRQRQADGLPQLLPEEIEELTRVRCHGMLVTHYGQSNRAVGYSSGGKNVPKNIGDRFIFFRYVVPDSAGLFDGFPQSYVAIPSTVAGRPKIDSDPPVHRKRRRRPR
jgi:hypothetical protein